MTAFSIRDFFARVMALSSKLRQPRPAFSVLDVLDAGFRHPVALGKRLLVNGSVEASDFKYVALRQNGEVVSLAPVTGLVLDAVHLVFGSGFPFKVSAADASKVALAARVGGVMRGRGGWAIDGLANPTRSDVPLASDSDAGTAFRERPDEAVRPGMLGCLTGKSNGFTLSGATAFRVTVPHQPDVVLSAKPARTTASVVGEVVARFDRTWFWGISHSRTLLRSGLVRARRTLERLGGLAASTTLVRAVEA